MADALKALIFVVVVLVYACTPTKSHAEQVQPVLKMTYTLSPNASKMQCINGLVYAIKRNGAPPKPVFYSNSTIVRC